MRAGAARRAATLALYGLVAAFFAREALFGGRAFFLRDLHLQWFGQVESFVRAVTSGSWPLWDPYVSFGQPMLANANVQVLYPLTWLNLLVRPYTYYTFYFMFHLVMAGAGTAALTRRFGASEAGAFVAGCAWIASGPFLSLGNLWNHLAGATWLPWTLLAADHALAGSRRGVAAWALALAATIAAGSPDFALLGLLLAGGLLLERLEWSRSGLEANRRTILFAGLAVGLGLGMAAAQVLPSIDVALRSTRFAPTLGPRTYWSAHPALLAQALVPVAWDALPWSAPVRARLFESREPYLLSIYLGLPVLALAVGALATRTVARRRLLGAGAALFTLIALGARTPVYPALALLPPFQALRFPVKALVPAALCVAILAGLGFDAWRARASRAGPALVIGSSGLAAGALAFLVCRLRPDAVAAALLAPGAGSNRDVLARAASAGATLACLGLATLLLAIGSRRSPRAARASGTVLAGLALAQLLAFHAELNPTAPVDLFRWRPDALRAVEQADGRRLFVYDYGVMPGASRAHLGRDAAYVVPVAGSGPASDLWRAALGLRAYPVPPVGAAYGVFDSFGRDLLRIEPLPLVELNAALFGSEGTPGFDRLLRIGAVSQVLALHDDGLGALDPVRRWRGPFFEDMRLFRVPDPLPRAFLVGESRVGDVETLLDPAFDPTREVVLAEAGPQRPSAGWPGEARLVELGADRVEIEVDAPAPRLLVLVDAYDPGWRARVDGRTVPVLRANVAFRAVPVPAGRHRVEMVYRPFPVTMGLAASLVSALVLAAWVRRGPA